MPCIELEFCFLHISLLIGKKSQGKLLQGGHSYLEATERIGYLLKIYLASQNYAFLEKHMSY